MYNPITDKETPEMMLQGLNPGGSDFKLDPTDIQKMLNYEHYQEKDARKQDRNLGLEALQKMGFAEGIMSALETDAKSGISGQTSDIKKRQKKYLDNQPSPIETQSAWQIIYSNLEDPFNVILIIAAVVSLTLGVYQQGWKYGWIDGLSICIALTIITTVNTANEKSKQDSFRKLMEAGEKTISKVIRNEATIEIDSTELVVGDIVVVENGKKIPADIVLIQCEEVKCDQADMTGESEPIEKSIASLQNLQDNPNPFLLQNSIVVNGSGLGVVVAVGEWTQLGKIEKVKKKMLEFENDPTPLQQKLDTLVNQIGFVGCAAAGLTFIAMFIRLLCSIFISKDRTLADIQNLADILNAFAIAITVIVMAIPEGLPLAVAICLAFSVGKLQNQEMVQIKKIEATEIMGGAEEICTDKTGTLTTGKMEVDKVYVNCKIMNAEDVPQMITQAQKNELLVAFVHNVSATYTKGEDRQIFVTGNPTDAALLKALRNTWKWADEAYAEQDTFNEIKDKGDKLFITPHNSTRKRMTTAIRQSNGNVRVYVKGTPNIILPMCSKYYDANSKEANLTDKMRQNILSQEGIIGKFASESLRCVAIGYVEYKKAEWAMHTKQGIETMQQKEKLETGLKLLMITGIKDPLKKGIPQAVQDLRDAGVNTRMITGDNIKTAIAIAKEANILARDWDQPKPTADQEANQDFVNRKKYTCMEGPEFCKEINMSEEQIPVTDKEYDKELGGTQHRMVIRNLSKFRLVAQYLKVMANSSPESKLILVKGLRGKSIDSPDAKVVAVTGDGTNDALALQKADVGFAMNSGSEAAKKAGSVVLLTDDFSKTLVCVKYGRNIFDCVRKFLQFQMTVNVVAMAIVFMGAAVFGENVMTSVQILWVNLIMDTFAALALATEAPHDDLLQRKPHKRNAKIIDSVMWRNIFGQTIFQVIALLFTLTFGRSIFGYDYPSDMGMYMTEPYLMKNPQFIGQLQVGDATPKLHVYTVAFQLFVFMQLFNQINARKLGKKDDPEFNVFKGIMDNYWFLGISGITFALQLAIVFFGGRPLRTVPLTTYENFYAIGLASLVLPWQLFIKQFMPTSFFEQLALSEIAMTAEDRLASPFASSSRQSYNSDSAVNASMDKGNKRK